jgi:predicted kinase
MFRRRRGMSEQDNSARAEEMEASGLLLSAEPLAVGGKLVAQAGDTTDTDTDLSDTSDATDADGTDESDADGSDETDGDGTDGSDGDASDDGGLLSTDSDGSDATTDADGTDAR